MGTPGGLSKPEQADIVPVIRPELTIVPTPALPPSAPGRDAPSNETYVPYIPDESGQATMVAVDWFDYWARIGSEPNLVAPGGAATLVETIPAGTVTDDGIVYGETTEDEEMGWITETIGEIYTTVDQNVFGGALPGGYIAGQAPPAGFINPATVMTQGTGAGVVQGAPPPAVAQAACGNGPSPVYKKVCGVYKWVYPKRRRRRSLATKGDIRDIGALKSVLGGGKALDTWIATHS